MNLRRVSRNGCKVEYLVSSIQHTFFTHVTFSKAFVPRAIWRDRRPGGGSISRLKAYTSLKYFHVLNTMARIKCYNKLTPYTSLHQTCLFVLFQGLLRPDFSHAPGWIISRRSRSREWWPHAILFLHELAILAKTIWSERVKRRAVEIHASTTAVRSACSWFLQGRLLLLFLSLFFFYPSFSSLADVFLPSRSRNHYPHVGLVVLELVCKTKHHFVLQWFACHSQWFGPMPSLIENWKTPSTVNKV